MSPHLKFWGILTLCRLQIECHIYSWACIIQQQGCLKEIRSLPEVKRFVRNLNGHCQRSRGLLVSSGQLSVLILICKVGN